MSSLGLDVLSERKRLRRSVVTALSAAKKCTWVRLVDTQSMRPVFQGHTRLLIKWAQQAQPVVGDVAAYWDERLQALVVHRVCVVDLAEKKFLQIADNPERFKRLVGTWVPLESLLGIVVAVELNGQSASTVRLDTSVTRVLSRLTAELSWLRWLSDDSTARRGLQKRRLMHYSGLLGLAHYLLRLALAGTISVSCFVRRNLFPKQEITNGNS